MNKTLKFKSQEDKERYEILKDVTWEDCTPTEEYLGSFSAMKESKIWPQIYKAGQKEAFAAVELERDALCGVRSAIVTCYSRTGTIVPIRSNYKTNLPSIHKDHKLKKAMAHRIGDKSRNTYDFGTSTGRWVQHGLSSSPDIRLVDEMIGDTIVPEKLMPQQMVFDITPGASIDNLIDAACHFPNVAAIKGIETFSTVETPSTNSTVGKLYLMKATIVRDLMKAMRGEISIFSVAPRLYWILRRSLNPRTINGFAYSFDASEMPEFSQLLSNGRIGLYMEKSPDVGLAWPTGNQDPFGNNILTNTLPALTEADIDTIGIQVTERLFTRILSVTDRNGKVESEPEYVFTDDSAAAFAQTQDFGAPSYQTFGRVSSEVEIHHGCLWIAALDLAKGNDRRGSYIYNENRGPSAFVHRILNNDSSQRHIRVVPKQINFANIMLAITSQLLQADIIKHDYPTSGQVLQDQQSFCGSVDSGSLVEYVGQICSKRFAEGATVMAGSLPLNDNISIMGAGTSQYATYDTLTSPLPVYLTEAFAEMAPFIREENGVHLAYYPYLSMLGTKTRANPAENNSLGSGVNLVSMYAKMYPAVDLLTSDFKWATSGNSFPSFIDISRRDISLYTGLGPETRRTGVADLFNRVQSNLDVGPGLANVHDQEFTNLYYTEFMDPVGPTNEWDVTTVARVHSVGNKHAFSPNHVAHTLSRLLPVIYATEQEISAYVGITREVVSLQMDDNFINYKLPTMLAPAHNVAGWGQETAISDHAMIEQHLGGGFIDIVRRGSQTALPILKLIAGGVADFKVPGSSVATDALFDLAGSLIDATDPNRAKHDFAQNLLNNSGRNPYAPLLSPITHSVQESKPVMGVILNRKRVNSRVKQRVYKRFKVS